MLGCIKSYVPLQTNTCCCFKTAVRIVRLFLPGKYLYFCTLGHFTRWLVSSQVMKAHCLIRQDQDKGNIFFRKPTPRVSRSTCLVTAVVDPWVWPGKQPHYLPKGFCCLAKLILMTSLVKLKCTMRGMLFAKDLFISQWVSLRGPIYLSANSWSQFLRPRF